LFAPAAAEQQQQQRVPGMSAWMWAKGSLLALAVAIFVMHFCSAFYVRLVGLEPFGLGSLLHRSAAAYLGTNVPAPVAIAGAAITMQAARCSMVVPMATVHHHASVSAMKIPIPTLCRSDRQWFRGYSGDSEALFVGPSGSGKTTNFQIALSEMQRPCLYLAGREVNEQSPWSALAEACGVPIEAKSKPGIIKSALQIMRYNGLQPMAVFIDDVHGVFDRRKGAMSSLATWLLEMSIQGLITVNFVSSEARAEAIINVLPGFSKRFRTVIVPYAPIGDVTAYFKSETLLTDAQISDVIHVTGASLHDVGVVVARFLHTSATEEELNGVLDHFVELDMTKMNATLHEGVDRAKELSQAESIRVCSVVFEHLRNATNVTLDDVRSHLGSMSNDAVVAELRHLVRENLLLELPGFRFMFHDPRQRRTYERIRPEPVEPATVAVDWFAQYDDAVKLEEVIVAVSKQEGYSDEDMVPVLAILHAALVRSVGNLRALSVEQIKELGLPPVVTAYMWRIKKAGLG
jgi:hypothetical protein